MPKQTKCISSAQSLFRHFCVYLCFRKSLRGSVICSSIRLRYGKGMSWGIIFKLKQGDRVMKSKKMVISNASGLHVRPAGVLAKAAEQCSSRVELIVGNNIVNCRSILNILSMTIRRGDEVELCCTGPEEEADLEYMAKVIETGLEK